MATNTSKSIKQPSVSERDLQDQIKRAGAQFQKEKTVNVSIPKSLEPQLGSTLPIGINGAVIVLPVDGKDYPIPETFAKYVKEYLNNL